MNKISSSLPLGWKNIPLGKLGKYINGRAFKPSDWEKDGLPIIRIQNLTNSDSSYNYYSKPVDEKYYVRNGDLLIAWSATLGAYIWEGSDAILNQHIFRVEVNTEVVDKLYLKYVVQFALDELQKLTHGATMRHVTKGTFENFLVPVPTSLEEQSRIVFRLESLLREVAEARKLHKAIFDDTKLLGQAIFFNSKWDATLLPMRELVSQKPLDVLVNESDEYQFAGVKSFGRGVFPSRVKKGSEISYRQLTRLSVGDFTYPKLMAWEGALGVVPKECENMVISPEFPVFSVREEKVLPDVLDVYFKSPMIWEKLADLSTGSNARRRRLHPNVFLNYQFPVPPRYIQEQIREAQLFLTLSSNSYKDNEQSLDYLEQSVLRQAFQGEL